MAATVPHLVPFHRQCLCGAFISASQTLCVPCWQWHRFMEELRQHEPRVRQPQEPQVPARARAIRLDGSI